MGPEAVHYECTASFSSRETLLRMPNDPSETGALGCNPKTIDLGLLRLSMLSHFQSAAASFLLSFFSLPVMKALRVTVLRQ